MCFSSSGAITNETSLFTYDSTHLLNEYYYASKHDPSFIPNFSVTEDPEDPLLEPTLNLCAGEGASFCKYDALSMRSLQQGNATLLSYRSHTSTKKALEPGEWEHREPILTKLPIQTIWIFAGMLITVFLFADFCMI